MPRRRERDPASVAPTISPRPARSGVGRPYDLASTSAILRATLAVLAERGYHATTLDEIAARAGSSKPTIYRRWAGKPQVIAEAIRHALASANPEIPHTGDPRADVRSVLHNVIAALTDTPLGSAVRSLLDVAATEPELASCLADVERDRRAVLRAVLKRARPSTAAHDLELEIDLLLGAIYFRFLVRRTPIPRQLADALVARLIPEP